MRPKINVITDIATEKITIDLKLFDINLAEMHGKMMRLEISRAPIMCIPSTMITEQMAARMALYKSVLMPTDFANRSSIVMANIWR